MVGINQQSQVSAPKGSPKSKDITDKTDQTEGLSNTRRVQARDVGSGYMPQDSSAQKRKPLSDYQTQNLPAKKSKNISQENNKKTVANSLQDFNAKKLKVINSLTKFQNSFDAIENNQLSDFHTLTKLQNSYTQIRDDLNSSVNSMMDIIKHVKNNNSSLLDGDASDAINEIYTADNYEFMDKYLKQAKEYENKIINILAKRNSMQGANKKDAYREQFKELSSQLDEILKR